MTALPSNPRRGYKTGLPPTFSLLHSPTNPHHARLQLDPDCDRALKKSATFHSPKSPAADDDPVVHIPLLARRSPTSPKQLEDAVAAGEQRVSQLLGSVDRSLSGLQTFATDSQETIRPDEHPIPPFMLGVTDQDHMDLDSNPDHAVASKHQPHHNHHYSDSGIGSSVTASEDTASRHDAAHELDDYKKSIPSIINTLQSGINGAGQANLQHALSAYACRQIQKYLIVPILREVSLKSFHPLVAGIPVRVGRKEVTCLRDLEKVLLFLAPRFSESRSVFVKFCETSIQCLHTTAEYLNDSDQRRPTDRPYTNSYFVDLTEQVRQYAAMIAAARERLAAGRPQAGDEETTNSKISLEGGIGQTGRPAELVTTSSGRSISLATGEEIDLEAFREEAAARYGEDHVTHELLLSMARQRKANAKKVAQRCRECDKEFKRPCDLTKHEKTHTRPWKCNEPSCKYSQSGWPTEKERDRHVNDKHSSTPSMYKCQYHPCPYESKRESNCKQHMEKAHGWAYVRSKNNGKSGKKAGKAVSKSPPNPQMVTPDSHIFDASESEFGDSSTSPYMRTLSSAGTTANGSITGTSPYLGTNAAYTPSPLEPTFTYDQLNPTLTPQSPFTPASHRLSLDSTSGNDPNENLPPSFNQPMGDFDMPLFNNTFDWSNTNMDTDFQSLNVQLFTPAASIEEAHDFNAYHRRNPSISLDQALPEGKKLSPGAQGAVMLYSPHDQVVADEGFDEFTTTDMGKPTNDFALFDDSHPDGSGMSLFQDLPPFQSQTWNGTAHGFDTPMMDD